MQKSKIGMSNTNKQGCLMVIAEYNTSKSVVVEFVDNHKARVHTSYYCFLSGSVKNPYFPSVLSVGYPGIGEHGCSVNNKDTPQYTSWYGMLTRCYNDSLRTKMPTYEKCIVHSDWHNFQNYATWYNDNIYKCGDENVHLDKDLLIKNNKIYSSATCVFVPERINKLINIKRNQNLPIGVTYIARRERYISSIRKGGKRVRLGYFHNPLDAFAVYKEAKESYIKQVADLYKSRYPQFPVTLYNALYKYTVEIDD